MLKFWIQFKKHATLYGLLVGGAVLLIASFFWAWWRRKKVDVVAFNPGSISHDLTNRMAVAHAKAAVEVIQARTKDDATAAELKRISAESDAHVRLQSLIALKNRLVQ